MSGEKEVKLVVPKSLMLVLWVAAIGFVMNRLKPLLSTQASANPNQVHKLPSVAYQANKALRLCLQKACKPSFLDNLHF